MDAKRKKARYGRIFTQIQELIKKSDDITARMCTISSVLHHKMDNFFWTGFYVLSNDEKLIVRCYQGPVACMELAKDVGVCWAGINSGKTVLVPNVHEFPGHIACDSRSLSEVVVPVRNIVGEVVGVLDVDSAILNNFDEVDATELEKIVALIYS